MSGRLPPHNLQAEESLLGAMLLSPSARAIAAVALRSADFYKPAHGHIFDAIQSLDGAGEGVDPVTVADVLESNGLLDIIGGRALLVALQAGTPATTSASRYADIVAHHAHLRRILATAGEMAELAYQGDAVGAAAMARQAGVDHTGDWTRPLPLGRRAQHLPTFPVAALPGWVRRFVLALAEATQTPVDLSAVLALAALATAAGGRAVVEVREGWREPTNIYIAVALGPGERKTPVFVRLTAPLAEAEEVAVADAGPRIAEAAARRQAALAAADDAQKKADHPGDTDREQAIHDAAAARMMAEAVTVPTMPRLLADDATPEALASLLADQGGRIAMLSDEGDVFSMMAGRYQKSSGPNLNVYLKAHPGSPLRVDRKGRPPEYIKAPALTLGLAVQPAVLESLAHLPGARGRGLLGRFLWALPASNLGDRKIAPPPIPSEVGDKYKAEIVLLVQCLAEWVDPAVIAFTPEADARLRLFETDLEPRLGPHGDLTHVRDWASKLAGHTARIAGLLHLAGNVRTGWGFPIKAETVDHAITVAHYLTAHALAVFDLIGTDPVVRDARDLLVWIDGRDSFSKRDAQQANRSTFTKADDVDPALGLLEAHGYIRRRPQPPRGRRGGRPPSPEFDVNPLNP